MDEEDKHSPDEFYYPEALETLDAETEMPYNKQLTNRARGPYWAVLPRPRANIPSAALALD